MKWADRFGPLHHTPTTPTKMNILHLEVSNLKRISAIEIDPTTGKPIILTGDNGAGKSSVIDSIILALANTGLDDPIRHGRPSGSVKLTLGADKMEYTLERKVTKSGDKLTLTDANGLPVQKPQTFLNGLLGNYAFDPLEFTRLKAKDQVEALKVAAGLDFTDLDAKRKEHYDKRTAIGKEGKEVKALLDAVPVPGDDVGTEEVSGLVLMDELRDLEAKQRDLEKKGENASSADSKRRALALRVSELEGMLGAAKLSLEESEKESVTARQEYAEAKEVAPTDDQLTTAREAIANVEATNRAIRSAAKFRELTAKRKALLADYASTERRIEEIDEKKTEAIKNAALPLDGLELTDDGVMVDGTFFSQLSTAEQIRISTLVAMSQNPKLKIVMIREGALLNTANTAMIASLAAERGYQVWIEKFQEQKGDVGIHIVDGAIAFEDGEPVTPAAE